MKKTILSLIAVLTIGIVAAQDFGFSKEDIFLEGNLKYSKMEDFMDNEKTVFEFTPSVGYFVNDDFALGLGLAYVSEKLNDAKESAYGAGFFGRYYFLDLGKRFKTYSQASFVYAKTKETDVKTIALGVDLGINYFVTERFAISFVLANLVDYTYASYEGESSSNFNVNLNEFENFFGNHAKFGLTYKF